MRTHPQKFSKTAPAVIKDFLRIPDYLGHSNIRLGERVDDFLIYHYSQLNEDAQLALKAYRHHFYEITLDVNMGCSFQIDNFTFENQKGALVVVSPKRLQSVHQSEQIHRGEGFSLFFDENFLAGHVNSRTFYQDYPFLRSTYSPVVPLSEKSLREMIRLFGLVRYEYREYGQEAKEIIKSLVYAILEKAKRNYTALGERVSVSSREVELVRRFEALVGEHFVTLASVKEYAGLLHVSDKYLSQVVKQVTGRNALAMLNHHRINYAKSLLLHTALSPTEVSHALHIANPNYFFTYFKKLTGQTPSAYQLENLKYSPPF